MIIYIYFINIIMIKKCFKNELNSQFRARSGPIRLDPVIRSDPVNTWTVRGLNIFQSFLMQSVVMNDLFV